MAYRLSCESPFALDILVTHFMVTRLHKLDPRNQFWIQTKWIRVYKVRVYRTVPSRKFRCGSLLPVFCLRYLVTFHLMCVNIIISSILVAEWPPFGK